MAAATEPPVKVTTAVLKMPSPLALPRLRLVAERDTTGVASISATQAPSKAITGSSPDSVRRLPKASSSSSSRLIWSIEDVMGPVLP
ncbi:MAG: hypothetical protein M3519_00900 [Actinomycetota bacterium]|nr:hypothetical protein [Actinomycetota bacterium]